MTTIDRDDSAVAAEARILTNLAKKRAEDIQDHRLLDLEDEVRDLKLDVLNSRLDTQGLELQLDVLRNKLNNLDVGDFDGMDSNGG